MIWIRSSLYLVAFVLWSAIIFIGCTPVFVLPRVWTIRAMGLWASGLMVMLRVICGIRTEVRGREHLPGGAALIGAKHQCMYDTVAPFTYLRDTCFVMKQELMIIPFYGWYSAKGRMIVVDRDAHAKALRKLLADAKAELAAGRQIIIFPEGTRTAPGEKGEYKPGVAALYRELGVPCVPVATNSGYHWPPKGFLRRPGTVVFEYLEPIPAGLKRAEFMRTLEERIETASAALADL